MEKELNIAAILKDKPQGTKLYDWLYNIDIELDTISTTDTETVVWCTNKTDNNTICHRAYSEFGTVRGCTDGLQILLPSKEMRDWSKFAWKKGDVLVDTGFDNINCIFDAYISEDYTKFRARYCYRLSPCSNDIWFSNPTQIFSTKEFMKDPCPSLFIKKIEEHYKGKLNRETLEIEKPQPEFKDGDIVTIMPHIGDKLIYLFKTEDDEKYYGHAYLDGNIAIINEDSYCQKDFCTTRLSTEEEKQYLFDDALAKEGKRWNAEKKIIEDAKKEYQFKPFEKVLTRDSKDSLWHIDLYERALKDDNEYNYRCMAADWVYCIPYEGNETLLGTTKDLEE